MVPKQVESLGLGGWVRHLPAVAVAREATAEPRKDPAQVVCIPATPSKANGQE